MIGVRRLRCEIQPRLWWAKHRFVAEIRYHTREALSSFRPANFSRTGARNSYKLHLSGKVVDDVRIARNLLIGASSVIRARWRSRRD